MITVFTPSYNRVLGLRRLYTSLCRQTCKKFQWLIVNDGSTDATEDFINSKVDEAPFKIIYIYQPNQGKHIAYNSALDLMDPVSWHVCVDSDDTLEDDAIETFYNDSISIESNSSMLGIIYPKKMKNIEYIRQKLFTLNIPDLQFRFHLNIETVILFKRNVFKKIRFPKFNGEKFLSEESVYIKLIDQGRFLFIPHYLYNAEYQEDGLTQSLFKNWEENYHGTIYTLNKRYEYINNQLFGLNRVKERLKCLINMGAVCVKVHKNYLKYTPNKLSTFLLTPIILFWCFKRF